MTADVLWDLKVARGWLEKAPRRKRLTTAEHESLVATLDCSARLVANVIEQLETGQ